MKPNHDGIPQELKNLDQWCLWKIELDEKNHPTKVPYQTNEKYKASSTNRKTWTSYKNACNALEKNSFFDGIGFFFSEDDPYTFIDLDKCVIDGNIESWALDILQLANSYAEFSQSGMGIHILLKGSLNTHTENREGHFEVYDKKRYCAITGNKLSGFTNDIQERQAELQKIYDQIFCPSPEKNTEKMSLLAPSIKNTPTWIIKTIKKAKNGVKFDKLMSGDWSDYPSQSEAESALAWIIAFYTHDYDLIESVMQLSAFSREKWEKNKGYLQKTINNAIENVTLGTILHIKKPKQTNNDPESDKKEEKKIDKSEYYYVDENGKTVFSHGMLAEELMQENIFICADWKLFIYIKGVYKAIGDDYVESMCQQKLEFSARNSRICEVMSYIKRTKRIETNTLNTNKYLINLENGMYDVKNDKLLEHSPDYLSTIRIPVIYNSEANINVITDWLKNVLGDNDCIQLAFEFFGYCLIPDTTIHKAFMLVGAGNSGKSTFLNVLGNFLGEDNYSSIPLQELSENRFKRAELFGKLVNLFADLDNRDLKSTSFFKAIVAGDMIDAERKNQNPFKFRPFSRLIYSANDIPNSPDISNAYYRRWNIMNFDRQFVAGQDEIKGFSDELSKPENLSALLNCALYALQKLLKNQLFTETVKGKESLENYKKQNDPVRAFVDECCEFIAGERVERKDLYDSFCRYCDESGFKKEITRNYFYQRLRIFREIKEIRLPKERYFEGIKLL